MISALASACATGPELTRDVVQAFDVEYGSDRGDQWTFDHDQESGGKPTAWIMLRDGLGPGMDEGLGNLLRDCGARKYRCLSFAWNVLVAPPTGASPGDTFEVGSAKLAVLTCEKRVGSACSRYIVRSTCDFWSSDERCEPDKSVAALREPGETVFYRFDMQDGVVAFSKSATCTGDGPAARCELEGGFTLDTRRGLLAAYSSGS